MRLDLGFPTGGVAMPRIDDAMDFLAIIFEPIAADDRHLEPVDENRR